MADDEFSVSDNGDEDNTTSHVDEKHVHFDDKDSGESTKDTISHEETGDNLGNGSKTIDTSSSSVS